MAKILYLVHRLPYPPNKGDKVRSFHLLKHLAAKHQVFLATFVDDPDDRQYIAKVREFCTELHVSELQPALAKLKSLQGLLSGEALSLPYYRDAGMSRWVQEMAKARGFDAVIVFSSPMAQYVQYAQGKQGGGADVPVLIDFVDVDSAKWADYANSRSWPMSWLYRREGRQLLAFEADRADKAVCSFFVTDKEVALFRQLTPGRQAAVESLCNGVDAEFFAPADERPSPFPAGQLPLVFTGAMDYWPNADAVTWFAAEVLPSLRAQWPALHFHIVGRSPTPAVQALAGEGVSVSGTVPDVRPYLQHAAAVVAPLRLARGIQNKILEAMAMGQPVVAAQSCVQAIDAIDGQELVGAAEPADFVRALNALLADPQLAARIGAAGRARVQASYSWDAHLAGLDRHLAQAMASTETQAA